MQTHGTRRVAHGCRMDRRARHEQCRPCGRLREPGIGHLRLINDDCGRLHHPTRDDRRRGCNGAVLPRSGDGEADFRLRDQIRSLVAADSRRVDRPHEGQRNRRVCGGDALRTPGPGCGRRLCRCGQQHGSRRRRICDMDARSPREGQGLGLARALLCRYCGQDTCQRFLRATGQPLVFRRLLQWRTASADDGAELSVAVRRHRRRCAVEFLS